MVILGFLLLFGGVIGLVLIFTNDTGKDVTLTISLFVIGIVLIIMGTRNKKVGTRKNTSTLKDEKRRYKYYLTNEGKSAILPYLTNEELEEDWDIIARTFSTENGQRILRRRSEEAENKKEG